MLGLRLPPEPGQTPKAQTERCDSPTSIGTSQGSDRVGDRYGTVKSFDGLASSPTGCLDEGQAVARPVGTRACPSEKLDGVLQVGWLYGRNEYSSQMTSGSAARCARRSQGCVADGDQHAVLGRQPTDFHGFADRAVDVEHVHRASLEQLALSRQAQVLPGVDQHVRHRREIDRNPSKSSRRHGSSIQ